MVAYLVITVSINCYCYLLPSEPVGVIVAGSEPLQQSLGTEIYSQGLLQPNTHTKMSSSTNFNLLLRYMY